MPNSWRYSCRTKAASSNTKEMPIGTIVMPITISIITSSSIRSTATSTGTKTSQIAAKVECHLRLLLSVNECRFRASDRDRRDYSDPN